MHHCIKAEFSLNTPLFASGADRNYPELRVSEIKAALRFWWRAMNYRLYVSKPELFVDTEAQLFGGASASQGQGVLVSLVSADGMSDKIFSGNPYANFASRPGARYLGYGLMGYTAVLQRACIKPGGIFEVRLNWRSHETRARVHGLSALGDADFQTNLVEALETFGTFGGLGSRSRRGYGSVTLKALRNADGTALSDSAVAKDCAELKKAVTDLLKFQRTATYTAPEDVSYSAFTCLSRHTIFELSGQAGSEPYPILNAMGNAFVRYRAWGHEATILKGDTANLYGEPAKQIFKADHDSFRNRQALPTNFKHPDRIVFGLPHPYSKFGEQSEVWGGKDTRRASPLFFHVHKTSTGQYLGLMFDLRSEFLAPRPTGGPGIIKDPKWGTDVPLTPDWSMLDELHNGEIPAKGSTRSTGTAIKLTKNVTLTKIF